MPTRTLFRLSLLAALAAPLCAFALGVGPLAVRSALNQNFEADIPLLVNNPGELTGLTVRIPRQEDFDRAGIERLALLSKLRFSVQTPPGGPNLIKISSVEPIREPNFNLLLELVWSRGRLIREFTVQVDPELYANRRLPPPPPTPTVIPPPVAAAPAPAPAPRAAPALPPAPAVSFEGASTYGPIRPGETLIAVANRVRPSTAIGLPQMMSILLAGNSGAFVDGNPDALRTGAMLKVPTAQALGVQGEPAPPPTVPDLAAAPPATQPPATLPPVEPAITEPPAPPPAAVSPPVAVSPPPAISPPAATEPGAPVTLPTTPAPSILSPAEQPQEIVPQATIPQAETPPPEPVAATAPSPVAPPAPPVAKPQPEPAAPAAKPPVQPVAETEYGWMANPVVWIAVALILLAIISVILLPLLRRPARPKPAAKSAGAAEPQQKPAVAPAATGEPTDASSAPTQIREPSLTRPLLHAAAPEAGVAAAAARQAELAAPKPVAAPQPRSVTELLRDIDFGGGESQPAFGGGNVSPTPTLNFEGRLPDAEPPTASAATGKPTGPSKAEPPTEPEPRQTPPQQPELPSELRLDGFDFDFGELGLRQPSQPGELPPLEMKPVASGAKFSGLPPGIDMPEPATEPASISSISSILSAQQAASGPSAAPATPPAAPEKKFQFTDITQEIQTNRDFRDDSLKLDEELHNFGSQTLDLGKMKAGSSNGGGDTIADYVETKLDLATAFLDMGDQVGARGLLEEVLQDGNASQKQRAEELLKKVVG